MPKTVQRSLLGRGKGYFNAAGPQARFIAFLLTVLIIFTLILGVVQKLAKIVQLPVFLPVSLVILLVFIGVVGTIYSHTFVGPLARIRKALQQLAEGDTSVSLRLRDSDDPALKDLVAAIGSLCDHSKKTQASIRSTAQDLFANIAALEEKLQQGADRAELQKEIESIRKKQEALDKALQSCGKI